MAGKNGSEKLGKVVEAGLMVAKIAQAKAEEALRDVVHISEVQRNQMKELFDEAAKKSRASTEVLIKTLRKEIENQLRSANIISKEEFTKFSDRLSSLSQDIGKMSTLRDEISKLTDMVNSLIHATPKPQSDGKEKTDESAGDTPVRKTGTNSASEAAAPRKRTPRAASPKPAASSASKSAPKASGGPSPRPSGTRPRPAAKAPRPPKAASDGNDGDSAN